MADLSSIPNPTPKQFMQEYHFYRDQQPALYSQQALYNENGEVKGYDAGYKPGFELGRRSAVPVAYQMHLSALGEIFRRAKEIRADLQVKLNASSGLNNGMVHGQGHRVAPTGMMVKLGTELGKLEGTVEYLVRKTAVAAGEGGLGLDELTSMVVGGGNEGRRDGVELCEFLRMALDGERRGWGTAMMEKRKHGNSEKGG
ncbi:hypothetical protein N657DRAFT_683418 [Parathielavia appendiculata]|uniref:Uncharacterized protein n=1 Tax=Parathielavia appendiculata TaxID=2587402 RepID=A0AAN6TUR5_9PEZI|nr:hypothetical protein N657DRAFT_683418 [Parathielavia appendiculata]